MNKISRLLAAVLSTAFFTQAALAAQIGNADVIKLLGAGMPEEVVLQAIEAGNGKFDTSANALIALKAKGATPNILKAILAAATSGEKPSSAAQAKSSSSSSYNPEEITLVLDGQSSSLQYIIPQTRTAARALGFGGMATYATLSGEKAQRRIAGNPEFIVSVPRNAQANNYLTLANFAVRNNGTREVMTGGGYMSYSSGINKSRVVPVTIEPLADQSAARDGFILHKITPVSPMVKGEYALVLYTGEMRTSGFFTQAANSYFDFGVD
ncbi:hypothetical protein NM04_12605 [Massilia aurea]|uniref:Uncharacterized protein n=1 Tax=Massilia aurea TaxID=373040 RepID=A0A422QKD5_9BURK|nr:hypothetical protein [Massilia aurea]RNF30428.1 hypothetical protein NM04_12605 [Massilia aurea]